MSEKPADDIEREQPKPAQPVSRDLDYVREHDGLLGLPLLCWECGGEVENDSYEMILLSDGNAVCRGCSEVADEIVATSLSYGYPNNNVGLDLDEATRWFKIEDRLDLNEIGKQSTAADQ